MNEPDADFTALDYPLPEKIVFLVDLDLGHKTVTNDAEAVVAHCLQLWPGWRIIYRDTEKRWSELAHDGRKFVGFKPYTGEHP